MNKTGAQIPGNAEQKKQYLLQTYKDIKQIKNNTIIKTVLSVHCLRALVSYYTELNDTNKNRTIFERRGFSSFRFPGWIIKKKFSAG